MNYDYKKLIVVLLLLLPTLAFAQGAKYVIKGWDVLRITVYDHPDLDTTVRVGETGDITFPLLGEVKVDGLTVPQVEKKLADMLAKGIIVNPQITVFVEEFKVQRVTVIGEVNKPGQYPLLMDESTYVADMISNCLGVTRNAGEILTILRKAGGKQEKILVELPRLLKDGDLSQNVELMSGDLLYVPKAGYFYIYGEVEKPAFYRIEPGMTLIKAISMAGGPKSSASTEGVRIIRKDKDGEASIRVKLYSPVLSEDEFFEKGDLSEDLKIEDEDVIYVPRAPYVYIYGEVEKPSRYYKQDPHLTLIEALAMAGGPKSSAATENIQIIRKKDGVDTTLKVELHNPILPGESFFEDNDMSQNIEIQDEDVIYVPRAAYFYVYGEVAKPGLYSIQPGFNVIKAISRAGGVTDKASTSRIEIKRKKGEEEVTIPVELSDPIQGEDVIIVPESFF